MFVSSLEQATRSRTMDIIIWILFAFIGSGMGVTDYQEIDGVCKEHECSLSKHDKLVDCVEGKIVPEKKCCAWHGQLCPKACSRQGDKDVEVVTEVTKDLKKCHVYNCRRSKLYHLRREMMPSKQCCDLFGILCKVTLMDGQSKKKHHSRGLVKIQYEDEKGFVCADKWDANDAKVVCRMLGFKGEVLSYTESQPDLNIISGGIKCTGDEEDIGLCSHIGIADECRGGIAGASCDQDECVSGENDCGDNTNCINIHGGFNCPCKHGYQRIEGTKSCKLPKGM